MMGGQRDHAALARILCCLCGTSIEPNAANMCSACLRTQVDLSLSVVPQATIAFCRGCGRYQRPPWQNMELESAELLGLCLKRIKGLEKLKLIDAGFIWTEPHSRRLKVKLTVQKEAAEVGNVIVEQSFVVEIIVQPQQCEDCARSYTEHTWKSCVQVRQRVKHKRTFLLLEQLMIKHNQTANVLKLEEIPGGLDFFFSHRSHSQQLVDFISSVAPSRSKSSKRLISQDLKSNTSNYKYTFFVEIVPMCRYDLVCLPAKVARGAGGISPLLLCDRVTTTLHLVDFSSLQVCDVSTSTFFRNPFRSLLTQARLIDFIVIDVDKTGESRGKYALAEVTCARASDFGVNDITFEVITHLGNLLSPGDTAAGYDLTTTIFNDDDIASFNGRTLPDAVLVKKTYPDSQKKRKRKRRFKLKTLEKVEATDTSKRGGDEDAMLDEELFLQEIEEDPELRGRINLYARDDPAPSDASTDAEDVAFPEVSLDELIQDFDQTNLGSGTTFGFGPMTLNQDTEVGHKRRNDDSIM